MIMKFRPNTAPTTVGTRQWLLQEVKLRRGPGLLPTRSAGRPPSRSQSSPRVPPPRDGLPLVVNGKALPPCLLRTVDSFFPEPPLPPG
jgi:hypothetical protein